MSELRKVVRLQVPKRSIGVARKVPSICLTCAKDEVLKEFIRSRSIPVARCDVCGAPNALAVDADTPELKSMFRALIRLHYSEWEYNTHWGGDNLERIFLTENAITNFSTGWDLEIYEDILLSFIERGYEEYDKGITLFAGYLDGIQLPLLRSLKSTGCSELSSLEKKLRTLNHFVLEPETDGLLRPHVPTLSRVIPEGTAMYRARIGFEMKALPLNGWGDEWHHRPYSARKLGAPPPAIACGGRLNRPGISFLYVATDENTAICEVRPHPGHSVSVGTFKCIRPIRVADFTAITMLDFFQTDKLLDQFHLLKTINDLLGFPIVPEERAKYSLTQLISDSLRRLGFDGVVYRSSVGSGLNVAIFDASSFEFVEGSSKCVQVSELKYAYKLVPAMASIDSYLIDGDGNPL